MMRLNRIAATGALTASLLLLAGCVTVSGPAWLPGTLDNSQPYLKQLDPGKAPTGLKSVGTETDQKLEQSAGLGLIHLPALEDFLNEELDGIKSTIGFPDLPGKVYLLASPSMNAMTSADGNIYIPVGMVVDIDSTDEVLALLAHETAHTLLDHTDTDLLLEIQKKGTAAWAIANQMTSDSQNKASINRRVRNALAFSLAADKLVNPTWNRQQELDADRLAIDILVARGMNPDGLIALLNRLDRWNEINESLRSRIEDRNSLLVEAAIAQFAEKKWQADLMKALTPVGLAIEDKVAEMADTHMSSEERIVAAREYMRTHYRRVARPAPQVKMWKKVAHSAAVRRQVDAVRKADDAYGALLAGNVSQFQRAVRGIRARDGARQNYYVMLNAMAAEEAGKYEQVGRLTMGASELAYPSFRLLVMQQRSGQMLLATPSEPALRRLVARFDEYGKPQTYYADLIQLAEASGNTPFKYELVLKCYVAYFGNKAACSSDQSGHDSVDDESTMLGGLKSLFLD